MPSVPPYQNAVEVAGTIQKVTRDDDRGGIFVNLHNFRSTIQLFISDEVIEDCGFKPDLGMTVRALSTNERRAGFWLAQSVRVQ